MAQISPRYLLPFDAYRLPHHLTDVLVVGTGVAGYSAALQAARGGQRVMLLAKGDPQESNTAWAQGGVAAVMERAAAGDSPAIHARDTLEVGQGICAEALVYEVAEEARVRIAELVELGARFDQEAEGSSDGGAGSAAALGLEAGHTHPRVLHARGDATGAEIRDALSRAVLAHERVRQWGGAFVVDLLTDDDGRCRGALVVSRGHLRAVWAGSVVLCTGGYAQVFRETTNVPGATGDGIAAAYRAGAALQDLEFVQFHPTTLYLAGVPRLLITEAVRGEGAWIVDDKGERFLLAEDERAELAPRDVISRIIMRHLERPDIGGVYLELTHLDPAHMEKRFPGVVRSCRQHGLDIAKDRIPIRRRALQHRWRADGRAWEHRDSWLLRGGRSHLHRTAWGQPPRVQLALGGTRGRGPSRHWSRELGIGVVPQADRPAWQGHRCAGRLHGCGRPACIHEGRHVA